MKSSEIRSRFLDFYARHGHDVVPSASLIPSSYDPSVLLTTAGMQPFKPYFLGESEPPASTLTSTQKCFRTPDIDEVGTTARHLTFFEMLGNFSFGDYFKAGAIEMAWKLIVDELKVDVDKLWVTIHCGDDSMGIGRDNEAAELWMAQGMPEDRIVALGDDNFWKAGPTGPCGPCSELHYDRGVEHDGGSGELEPGGDSDRFLEFYNLVFMQYTRDDSGALSPLPKQNIDTGMGLERITAMLQGGVSVFEIDSFRHIIEWAEQQSGRTYGDDVVATKALRVLADHGRGMTFLGSDGVIASNEGRGYVLRRVIRRAVQQAERIGFYADGEGGVLRDLHGRVVEEWGTHYPELINNRDDVQRMLDSEEERFLRTLSKGSAQLAGVFDELKAGPDDGGTVTGEQAFQLHDTYGFPVELTLELADEQGFSVDTDAFAQLMDEQRQRARAAAGDAGLVPADEAAAFARHTDATTFIGWRDDTVTTGVAGAEHVDGSTWMIKLQQSPFYPEGGGQISDGGSISGPTGSGTVLDVMRFEDDQVVVVEVDGQFAAGDEVVATVDVAARRATEANHTATHLLHKVLREHLGDHVQQAGSLVEPGRLRFDFTHTTAVSPEELDAIERDVNAEIAHRDDVAWNIMSIDDARDAGAMMLFGEKYGETVRLVDVGEGWSRELCGGTHVNNTGDIGLFIVTSEGSVGSNTRRIEAVTSTGAVQRLRERAQVADAVAATLNTDMHHVPDKVRELRQTARRLEKELQALRSGSSVDDAADNAVRVGSAHRVVYRAGELTGDELLDLSDRLKSKFAPAAVLLGSAQGEKVSLIASVSDELVQQGVNANDLIKEVAGIVGGGGGGRPNMARAGGTDATRLDEALETGAGKIDEMLGGS